MNPLDQQKKARRGCLFYGLIVFCIMALVLLLASFLGYRYAKSFIEQYTDTAPVAVPAVHMPEAALQQLRDRIRMFGEGVDQGKPMAPLTLSEAEVNALLATAPEVKFLNERASVTLTSSNVHAQVSLPTDELGLRMMKGRYLNATGTFTVGLEDGRLVVHVKSLTAKGKPFPEAFMRRFRDQNLAEKVNDDPKIQAALSKLQEIRTEEGQVTIIPKVSQ